MSAGVLQQRTQRWAGDDRLARAAWSRLAEPTDQVAAAVRDRLGVSRALALVVDDDHQTLGGLHLGAREHRLLLSGVARWRVRLQTCDPEQDIAAMHSAGGRVLIPGDPEWPCGMDDLGSAAPPCLWVRGGGHLGSLTALSVALVGSRAATRYGEQVATTLGGGLGGRSATVVSGAAFGIDAAAHRGALAAGHPTVAILACGADRAYPASHTILLDRIAEEGVVASESGPGATPTRWRFLERNRLIAAATSATVVVEAAWRSGALSTAHHAERIGRPLAAVPGPVTSPASAGCHRLLRQGAVCVTDVEEVIELIRPIGQHVPPAPIVECRPHDDLDPDQLRVWEGLPPRGAMTVPQVCIAAGLPEDRVQQILGEFILEGRAHAGFDSAGRRVWRRR